MSIELKITAITSGAVKGIDTVGKKVKELGAKAKDASKKGLDSLDKGLGAINNKVTKISPTLGKLAGALGPVAGGFVVLTGAVAGTTLAMVGLATQTASMADNIGKASQRMDVSIEFYQRMSSAAGHAGTSIGTMESAMRKMLLKMTQVEQGNKLASKAFTDLGVSVFDSEGKMRNQEQVFKDVLTTLSKMTNHTERNAKAQEVLGRSASQLAPLFNEGADAVSNYIDVNDSAVVVSKELADSSALYNDTIQTMGEELQKAKNKGLEPFMKEMSELSVIIANSEGWDTFVGFVQTAVTELGKAVGAVADFAKKANLIEDFVQLTRIEELEEHIDLAKDSMDEYALALEDSAHRSEELNKENALGLQQSTANLERLKAELDEIHNGAKNREKEAKQDREDAKLANEAELRRKKSIADAEKIRLKQAKELEMFRKQSIVDLKTIENISMSISDIEFGFMREGADKETERISRTFAKLTATISDAKLELDALISRQSGDNVDGISDKAINKAKADVERIKSLLNDIVNERRVAIAKMKADRITSGILFFDTSMLSMMEAGAKKSTQIVTTEHEEQLAIFRSMRENFLITSAQYDALEIEQERSKQQQLKDIRQADSEERINNIASVAQKSLEITSIFTGGLSAMQDQRQRTSDSIFAKEDDARRKEIQNMRGSDKAKQKAMDDLDKDINKRKSEQFEKDKKGRKAQVAMDTASAIMSAWNSVASLPFPGNVIAGGTLTAALTGFGIAQASSIEQEQSPYFREGGVVGGFSGATNGPDNVTANVRNGEMILNAEQQRNLFNTIDSGDTSGGGSITISIENFGGGDDELEKLEDMLYNLQSSGRFSFA